MKPLDIPELGNHILIVMDNCDACVEMLSLMTESIPDIHTRYFTLIHCVPAIYWEHGGDEAGDEAAQVWHKEEKAFRSTQTYFEKAINALTDGGVPRKSIQTVTDCNSASITQAVLNRLRNQTYSGVILSKRHDDLVNLLSGRSLLRWFMRFKPQVSVWAVDAKSHIAL